MQEETLQERAVIRYLLELTVRVTENTAGNASTVNESNNQNLEGQIEKLKNDSLNLSDELIKTKESGTIKELLKKYYKENSDILECVYFARKTGEFFLMPSQVLPKGYDPRERPWYKNAIVD